MKGKIYIGTSGWHYKHWKGTFYPEDIKVKDQFAKYNEYFDTVEINNSFYRLPTEETFTNWRNSSSPNFLFVVKASRFITHMKKLKGGLAITDTFLSRIACLKEKLGPVLFQLPPSWEINYSRLEDFVKQLPTTYRYTFEFRNHTWYTEQVYELLNKYQCAFCIYELAGHLSPLQVTADFVYIRLHGPGNNKYEGSYAQKTLEQWSNRCQSWAGEGKDVFIYFDNDQHGYAAFNALTLKEMVGEDINN